MGMVTVPMLKYKTNKEFERVSRKPVRVGKN